MSHKKEMSEVEFKSAEERLEDAKAESASLFNEMLNSTVDVEGSLTEAVWKNKEFALRCLKCFWLLAAENKLPAKTEGAQL